MLPSLLFFMFILQSDAKTKFSVLSAAMNRTLIVMLFLCCLLALALVFISSCNLLVFLIIFLSPLVGIWGSPYYKNHLQPGFNLT